LDDARDEVELLGVQLEAKRADLQEAQVMLRQAQRTSERLARLAQSGAVGTPEVESARTELEVLEARLLGKQAQVRESEVRLKQARRHLERLQRPGTSRAEGPRAMQPPEGYPTPDASPVPRDPGGFSRAFPADRAGAAPGTAPPGGFGPPSDAAEAPRSGVGRGQGRGFGMGPGITGGGMGGGGGMAGGAMAGGMPGGMGMGMGGSGGMGGGMSMGRAGGLSAGAAPQYDRRLDNLEKRLDGLIKDVRTLKQLAEAQRQQETLLQDLVTELKQLRQSQQKQRDPSRP
jgi:hypothetical protein